MKPPVAARPLFLLDYDGTLAEVVEDPDRAAPHPEAPGLLGRLSRRHPLWILTGRRVEDVGRLLGVAGLRVIGVHGMEEGVLPGPSTPRVDAEALRRLERVRQEPLPGGGVRVEDKGTAIALHYRGVDDEARVVEELRRWAAGTPEGLEVLWGKKVVEVRPEGYSKGRATGELLAAHPGLTPVVIGDDTTDEDAFRAAPEGITVKVGGGESAARYRLADVAAVIDYLSRYPD